MTLLHAGVDLSVIALWLGHETTRTVQAYLHARHDHQATRTRPDRTIRLSRRPLQPTGRGPRPPQRAI